MISYIISYILVKYCIQYTKLLCLNPELPNLLKCVVRITIKRIQVSKLVNARSQLCSLFM